MSTPPEVLVPAPTRLPLLASGDGGRLVLPVFAYLKAREEGGEQWHIVGLGRRWIASCAAAGRKA